MRRIGAIVLAVVVLAVSAPRPAHAGAGGPISRGDANASGSIDLSDAIFLLQFLFLGGEAPVCSGVGDANSADGVDIADAVFILQFLFAGTGTIAPLSEEELAECEVGVTLRQGRQVFLRPDPLGNGLACVSCHGVEHGSAQPPQSGPLRVAHGVGDVVRRGEWFEGRFDTLLGAVNRCRDDWMAAPALAAEDSRWQALEAWLESIDDGASPVATPSLDAPPPTVSGPSSGDLEAGCALFGRACAGCHGESGQGRQGLGPSVWSRIRSADEWRELIRLSGPTPQTRPGTAWTGLLGNGMPRFAPERLDEVQLEDLVAYLGVGSDPRRRPCDSVLVVPPELVRAGTFRTILHGVRGRAEEWSDGTIRLREFFYDGRGPEDVLVWLYQRTPGDPHAILRGRAISAHMGRPSPYVGESLEFSIPDDITREDFNTVAIWCTEFQTNYGEAILSD